MYKGIFWICKNELYETQFLTVKVLCDENGNVKENVTFSSKSGENFNHKTEWENMPTKLTKGKPYNYYPRGRVEVKNGIVKIFIPPILYAIENTEKIKKEFDLKEPVKVICDGSAHYDRSDENE